jgi:subtilisin
MPRYVLINRRAGRFTPAEKMASRAAVERVVGRIRQEEGLTVLEDSNPAADPLARRIVVIDGAAERVAAIRAGLPGDAILEHAMLRGLQARTPPLNYWRAAREAPAPPTTGSPYAVTILGGDLALQGIPVLFHVQARTGAASIFVMRTDSSGAASLLLEPGSSIRFVEPQPYAGFWPMMFRAPANGAVLQCDGLPPSRDGFGWWHEAMGVRDLPTGRGEGIRVGVIDTGCGLHDALAHVQAVGTFVRGCSAPGSREDVDLQGHGTHTSGIIGALALGGPGYAGMASGCTLLHARVFDADGSPPTQADLVRAIDALSREEHCHLINISLGADQPSDAERDAIRDAAERGTLCICSSGNDASAIDYPAAYPDCIAVSALGLVDDAPAGTSAAACQPATHARLGDEQLFFANFSSFGPGIDCSGPGVGIISTVPQTAQLAAPYAAMDGTSMACPAVCGALAAILSADPVYKALPPDLTRTDRARMRLAHQCRSVGLAPQFEGYGLPTLAAARERTG